MDDKSVTPSWKILNQVTASMIEQRSRQLGFKSFGPQDLDQLDRLVRSVFEAENSPDPPDLS